MTQSTDSTWTRVSSIPEIAQQYATKLAEARAEAHRMIDAQFDQTAAEQMLMLEQLRREFEGATQH